MDMSFFRNAEAEASKSTNIYQEYISKILKPTTTQHPTRGTPWQRHQRCINDVYCLRWFPKRFHAR
jgi:hypothetical protein